MEIKFETKNLDVSLYQRMILHYIYEHYHYKDYKRYQDQDKWKITIISTKDFGRSFYSGVPNDQLDYGIPHGVTGKGTIICYVTDSNNPLIMLQNMSVICHELAHMILMVYYPDKLVSQRYDDFYGKAGDQRKFFSSEVHDRATEGKVKQFKCPKGWRKTINFVGIEISDLTNSRKKINLSD